MQSLRKLIILVIPVLVLVYGQGTSGSSGGNKQVENKEELNLVTVHAEDAHLPSILAILAKESGYNIVTDPNVNRQEKISIHLKVLAFLLNSKNRIYIKKLIKKILFTSL